MLELISRAKLPGEAATDAPGTCGALIRARLPGWVTSLAPGRPILGPETGVPASVMLVAVPPKNRMIAKPAESRMFRVPPQPHQSERAIDEPILIAPGNRSFIAS